MEKYSFGSTVKSVLLYTPADIVQHSFLVKPTLTPLNLEICQSYTVYDSTTEENSPSFTYSREFISTEEKCRKVLSERRSILYILHLDLPRDRERTLRSRSKEMESTCDFEIPQVTKVGLANDSESFTVENLSIDDNFYADCLYDLFENACMRRGANIELFKWFMKFNPLDKPVVERLPCGVINHLYKFARRQQIDKEIVVECMRRLNEVKWIITDNLSKSSQFSQLLYYFHQQNSEKANRIIRSRTFVNFFISLSSFQLAEDVLKLWNSPNFGIYLFQHYLERIVNSRIIVYRNQKFPIISQQRMTLLLQVIWIYLSKSENPQEGVKFLRLIWRSVPDSFLTSAEIKAVFEERFRDVYNFYREAMIELPLYATPRSLKHYSRIAIRRRLCKYHHWIPDGVRKLGIGKLGLEPYLNLKE